MHRTATTALLITLILAHRPTGPLAAQALARQDLALLETDRGTQRAQQELALGKTALERATRNGDWASYGEAVRHFEEAALHDPGLAEPWFGLALSRLALYETHGNPVISPTQPAGMPNRAAWAAHIRAALARDPRHLGALTSLGNVIIPEGDRAQPTWILTALARAESLGVVTPDLLLVHGRLATLEKKYQDAAAAFDAYATAGGDPSIAALERARAFAGIGDLAAAARSYLEGLDVLTSAGSQLYQQDLALVAERTELAPLAGLPLRKAGAWIGQFWLRRDAEDVRKEGDRLREHLRRWIFANERYRVVDPDRRLLFHEPWAPIEPCVTNDSFALSQAGAGEAADPLDPRQGERILDDRGLMYLRHGRPIRMLWSYGTADREHLQANEADAQEFARTELPSALVEAELSLRQRNRQDRDIGANSAEVWLYLIDGQLRSYLFTGSRWLGLNSASTLTSDVRSPELALLRAQVDPRYLTIWSRYSNPIPSKLPVACMVGVQRLARQARIDLMIGGSTDDDPFLFPHSAIPAVQVAGVGDAAAGSSQVVVAFAIPGQRLVPVRSSEGWSYPMRWRITAVDSTGVIRRDEGDFTRTSRDSLTDGQFLAGTLSLPLPAGSWQVGVALFQPDEQQGGAVEARTVRIDAGPRSLSDLIIGREEDPVQWNGVPMNPLGTWRRGSTLLVHTELRGLDAGTIVPLKFEVRQLDRDSGRPAVSLASEVTATGPLTLIDRAVDLGRLKPGVYRLTLTLRLADGMSLIRDRVFEVLRAP